MKKFILFLSVFSTTAGISHAQQKPAADFFEFGIRTSKFIASDFLDHSDDIERIQRTAPDIFEIIKYPYGEVRGQRYNYSFRLKYGKTIAPRAHLLAELNLSIMDEQVACTCANCDKYGPPITAALLGAMGVGLGARQQIVQVNKFTLSLEALGLYAQLINENRAKYLGYAISPLLTYQFSERRAIIFKVGQEKSGLGYRKNERFYELAYTSKLRS